MENGFVWFDAHTQQTLQISNRELDLDQLFIT